MEKSYQILKIVIWVLLFAVVIAGAYLLYDRLAAGMEEPGLMTMAPAETQGVTVGTEETAASAQTEAPKTAAPDFTFYDLEGNGMKLSDFQGKPVILNFWASWCGPCKSEMPEFQKFYEQFGEDIHFVLVNLTDGHSETVESAHSYIEGQGYTFPVYYDTDQEGAYAYSVTGVPVTYFLDAEGYFVASAQGALSESRLRQGIDLLLEK